MVIVGAIAAALAFGYGLAAAASAFGGNLAPAVVVALPLVPLLALAVLADARVGVIAVFAAIPVGTTKIGSLPVQLIIAMVAVFAGIVALRRLAAGVSPVGWAPPMWWLFALGAWTIVGFPQAVDQAAAIRQIAQLAGGILYASLIIAACRVPRDVRVVAGGFLAVSLVIAVLAVSSGHSFESYHGGAVVVGRAQGPFTQPNELGSFAAPMALLAVAVAVAGTTRRVRLSAAFVAFAIIAALALSLSRGAWIGFALGMAVLGFMFAPARRALLMLTPVLLVVALVLGAFAPDNPQVQVIGARLKSINGERNPYDDRPAIWREAQREMRERPLLGFGAGSFPEASITATSESRTTYASHAHNLFLTWGAETGFPGLALILAASAHIAVAGKRARRRFEHASWPDAAVVAGAAAALVAILGQGMVDYALRNSVIFVTAFGLLGLLLAATKTADSA